MEDLYKVSRANPDLVMFQIKDEAFTDLIRADGTVKLTVELLESEGAQRSTTYGALFFFLLLTTTATGFRLIS